VTAARLAIGASEIVVPAPRRARMTGTQRREQLLDVGRALFAERGFDAASIEEIAHRAGVSKPVVYGHFGGKEGLYAAVVERESERLLGMLTAALSEGHPRAVLQQAASAFLDYVEHCTDGFRILLRGSGVGSSMGTLSTLLDDVAAREDIVAHVVNLAWNGLSRLDAEPTPGSSGTTGVSGVSGVSTSR
jgi:AcrR family transcriptional regulator